MKTPIWYLISETARLKLKKRFRATAPPHTSDTSNKWEVTETSEEIEKIMSEAPRHVRRVD